MDGPLSTTHSVRIGCTSGIREEQTAEMPFFAVCPSELYSSFDRLIGEVSALSKDKDTYGLIHGDVSCGNYLNVGDKANIIDFDEAEYSWFVSDIATSLFYEIPIPWVVDGAFLV